MNLRPTQAGIFSLVRSGLANNTRLLTTYQEQIASGRRILRPSDDVVDATKALALRRQLASVERYRDALAVGRERLDAATGALQRGSGLVAEARSLLIQGMNGTLSDADRQTIATQLEQVLDSLLETANAEWNGDALFSGTAVGASSWQRTEVDGRARFTYLGNAELQSVAIGATDQAVLNVSGQDVFGRREISGAVLDGFTGLALGSSANQGSGDAHIVLRHDATTGSPGAGIALVNGGAADTLLGDRALVVDATAGTVTLGGGEPVAIGTPLPSDLLVSDEFGAVLHLDFSAWTGVDAASTVRGEGSIAIDGGAFTAIDFTATDLELLDPDEGLALHFDMRGVRRAGEELVVFAGATNVFGTLAGAIEDLRNDGGLGADDVRDRLALRLTELDRHGENLLAALGSLGGISARLAGAAEERADSALAVQSRLSELEDVDFASVVLDMTRAQQTLELAQASGVRLLQTNLLRFLG